MSERASGWYEDPDDPTQLRYWDGILWSDRRMPRVKPGLDASRIGTPSAYDTSAETPTAPSASGPSTPDPYTDHRPQTYGAGQQGQAQAYAAASGAQPLTPDGQRLSGWWRRFGAWVVDNILVGIVGTALALPWLGDWFNAYQAYFDEVMKATAASEPTPEMPQEILSLPVMWMVSMLVVYAAYEIGFLVWRGRTLGKMMTGISVRPEREARKPTFDEALRRFGIKGISAILNPIPLLSGLATIFTLVDGLWPLGDKKKQAIHDKVAKTVVVIGPPTGVVPPPQPFPGHYQPPHPG